MARGSAERPRAARPLVDRLPRQHARLARAAGRRRQPDARRRLRQLPARPHPGAAGGSRPLSDARPEFAVHHQPPVGTPDVPVAAEHPADPLRRRPVGDPVELRGRPLGSRPRHDQGRGRRGAGAGRPARDRAPEPARPARARLHRPARHRPRPAAAQGHDQGVHRRADADAGATRRQDRLADGRRAGQGRA